MHVSRATIQTVGLLLCLTLVALGCRSAPPPEQTAFAPQSLPDEISKPIVDDDSGDESSLKKSVKKMKARWLRLIHRDPNEALAHQHFDEGEALFRAKNYVEAAEQYKLASIRWPDSPLQEDAMFMQAESYFFANRYPKADDTYGQMMKKYENSRYLDKAVQRQFAIARYWEQLQRYKPRAFANPNFRDKTRPIFDTQGNAIAAYESVHLNDPTGPLADDSVMATANAHFLTSRYEDADHYYTILRTQYPQSEYQRVANLLDLRAKMRMYQGPAYDGKPLDTADELIKQINVQFPDLPDDEKARLRAATRAIYVQRAQRDFETAEFYAKTKHFRGARYYYQQVIEKYPDTRFPEVCRERLERYKGRPDNPKQHFTWLVKLFKLIPNGGPPRGVSSRRS